ncbi:MAG: hypothetical protein ACOC35_02745, partial [Promethearchaeia archaeon]
MSSSKCGWAIHSGQSGTPEGSIFEDVQVFPNLFQLVTTVRKNLDILGQGQKILGRSLTDDRGKRHMARTDDL